MRCWRRMEKISWTAETEFPHNLPDHDQQRSNRHAPTVKPETPSAVVRS